jgi:hypothetical protein
MIDTQGYVSYTPMAKKRVLPFVLYENPPLPPFDKGGMSDLNMSRKINKIFRINFPIAKEAQDLKTNKGRKRCRPLENVVFVGVVLWLKNYFLLFLTISTLTADPLFDQA